MHVPGGGLAVVDRLDRRLCDARDVPAEEDPRLTTAHRLRVNFRFTPLVHLHRLQRF